jgi:NitT/TauT family transport system substrate-binding protein
MNISLLARSCLLLALVTMAANPLVMAAESAPLRMAYLQNDLHHLALWVALEEGFFKEEGVNVNVAGVFRAGPEIMSAFAAGELDMSYVGAAPVTTAAANAKIPVKIVAQANTEGSGLVVADQHKAGPRGLKGLKELLGKVVAVPGISTVQDILLRKAFDQGSLGPKDVTVVVVKPPEMINALRGGDIAAFIAWQPYPAMAEEKGAGRLLLPSGAIWKDHPCCVLAVHETFLEKRRKDVSAVVRAHKRGTQFIRDNPERAVAIAARYTGMPKRLIRNAMATIHYACDLNLDGQEEYVRFLSDLGYIPKINAKDMVSSMVDQSILGDQRQ